MQRAAAVVVGAIIWGIFFGLIGATLTIIGLSSVWLFQYLHGVSPYLGRGVASGVLLGIGFGVYKGLCQRIKS